MLVDIEKDFYCSADAFSGKFICEPLKEPGDIICKSCVNRHRKHPTPEQYEKEYGIAYPDDAAVWEICKLSKDNKVKPGQWWNDWELTLFRNAKRITAGSYEVQHIVCACTPWGKPEKDWRP